MQSAVLRARLESELGERILSPFTELDKCVFDAISTGIAPLDAVIGGLPRGAITEIYGPPSSGCTSAAIAILAEATARNESCALVDGTDSFDPKSGIAGGVDLKRLLWVRCRKFDQALKTTDLLLQGGGFGCVAMDLSGLPAAQVHAMPLASWFRFQRAIEKTPTVLLVLSRESVVRSAAALVLRLEALRAEWSRLFNAFDADVEIVRCRRAAPNSRLQIRNSKSPHFHVRMHFRSQFSI